MGKKIADSFKCNGNVYYTRMDTKPHKGSVTQTPNPEQWTKVNDYNFGSFASDGKNKVECSNTKLGNTFPNYWKQCFCEIKPRFTPRFCGNEGNTCQSCMGNVVYGAYKYNGKRATFDQML